MVETFFREGVVSNRGPCSILHGHVRDPFLDLE
jgi:hypothetical protein